MQGYEGRCDQRGMNVLYMGDGDERGEERKGNGDKKKRDQGSQEGGNNWTGDDEDGLASIWSQSETERGPMIAAGTLHRALSCTTYRYYCHYCLLLAACPVPDITAAPMTSIEIRAME